MNEWNSLAVLIYNGMVPVAFWMKVHIGWASFWVSGWIDHSHRQCEQNWWSFVFGLERRSPDTGLRFLHLFSTSCRGGQRGVVCLGVGAAKALRGEVDGTESRTFTFPIALARPRPVGGLLKPRVWRGGVPHRVIENEVVITSVRVNITDRVKPTS